MVRRFLFSALLFALCLPVWCDTDVTIQLGVETQPERTKTEASRSHSGDGKVKIGDYGVIITDFATIRKTPSMKAVSRGFVPVNTYVVIQFRRDGFAGILMEDGTTGWIRDGEVKAVDMDVFARRTHIPSKLMGYDSSKMPFSDIITHAMAFATTPYVFGGTSISGGMDCSAFVREIFRRKGINLPRTAREQATVGTDVPKDIEYMQPGDRLYFRYKNSYIDHTGIYIGNGYYIHCNASK
ncbi:MAG: C40 family peptidase, partial [Abditibacteriota bacterium]|nr:C40 family peptidase [Abditibacteriota bacterium]